MADRRDLLRGLVALPLAAVPAVAVSTRALTGADPFTAYHSRILAILAAIEAGPGEEAADLMMDEWGAIDREALAGRPITFAGAAGALEYARREILQFQVHGDEATDDPSKRLVLHLLDGALGVLRQAATGAKS